MIGNRTNVTILQRERLLLAYCRVMLEELKNISPACFDVFLKMGHFSKVYEEVKSILERNFSSNAMTFTCTGESQQGWGTKPVVGLDFEFMFDDIFVFFRLIIGEENDTIELHHISFENSAGAPNKNTTLLEMALEKSIAHGKL